MKSRGARATGQRAPAAAATSELVVRAGSALVLAAISLFVTRAGTWPFAALVSIGAVITAWEWGRLVRGERLDLVTACHAASLVVAILSGAAQRTELAFVALAVGLMGVALLAASRANLKWSLLGVLYLGIPCIALMTVRGDSVPGWLAIAFLFTIVWCADTAAYAFGRIIGGPKLAPQISPKKTWSGFAGGVGVPILLAYGWALWLGNTSWVALALLGAGLSLAAQMGDLAESAAKRRFRAKDASRLIPGHGGLLDRVDALLFAAVVAGVVVALRRTGDMSSGAALLIWP